MTQGDDSEQSVCVQKVAGASPRRSVRSARSGVRDIAVAGGRKQLYLENAVDEPWPSKPVAARPWYEATEDEKRGRHVPATDRRPVARVELINRGSRCQSAISSPSTAASRGAEQLQTRAADPSFFHGEQSSEPREPELEPRAPPVQKLFPLQKPQGFGLFQSPSAFFSRKATGSARVLSPFSRVGEPA